MPLLHNRPAMRRRESDKMGAQAKHAASLAEIAAAEGTTVAAINVLLGRALKKLRRAGFLQTARELANELDRNRKGIIE